MPTRRLGIISLRLPARASRRRVLPLTHDPSSLFQPPEAVGPFRVRRVLASGTLGPRLLVEDDRGRLQILKLLTEVAGDGPGLAAVLEHVRRQLPAHPGLLPVTETGESAEGVYLVSPVLDAPSVEGRLRGGRQSLDATLAWLRSVTAGLQAAHDAGVWHGAIHPRDVLVTDEGGVLTGVGVAPALEHLSMQAPVRVPYTAPERASGRTWDARADQYSLAMLALDALSGRRLIAGTIPAFDRWTLAETPTEDARLHEVFVRALHPDPEQRYPSLEDWLAALAGAERPGEEGALSRFAREGVILAAPAAAGMDAAREIQVQPLEDPDGVALSLFPEEEDSTEAPGGGEVAPAPTHTVPADPQAEQEWLVADVPEDDVPLEPAPEPEPFVLRHAPAEHPPIDAPMMTSTPEADWRLEDEEPPVPAPEPARSWDIVADESPSRAPWLLLAVLIVVAALAYGTWQSLSGPSSSGPATTRRAEDPADEQATESRDETGSAGPREPVDVAPQPGAGVPPAGSRPVVPQASVPPTLAPEGREAPAGSPATRSAPAAAQGATPGDEASDPGVETGRALIRSSPSGEVRVNGRPRGETPVVLRDLPFGSYVVTISRPGFQTVEREVTLLPSQPVASITVDLAREGTGGSSTPPPLPRPASQGGATGPPAPAPAAGTAGATADDRAPISATRAGRPGTGVGAVFVVSTPPGARLYVDGRLYGGTPAAVPGLSPGTHTVRVEARGYRTWEGQVQVVAGTRVRVHVTLQQQEQE